MKEMKSINVQTIIKDLKINNVMSEIMIKQLLSHNNDYYGFWSFIAYNFKLSENFMTKYADCLDWSILCEVQSLREEFITSNKNLVDWYMVCKFQTLSEKFIEDNKYFVVWELIAERQLLSQRFINKHLADLPMYILADHQKLSLAFRLKYNLKPRFSKWLYKGRLFKRAMINKTGLFECHKDYFIGYKIVRKDRHSIHGFHRKYETGNIVNAKADYSGGLSTYGMSVSKDYENRSFIDDMKIRVKVYYKDVTCFRFDSGMSLRCSKLTVLD